MQHIPTPSADVMLGLLGSSSTATSASSRRPLTGGDSILSSMHGSLKKTSVICAQIHPASRTGWKACRCRHVIVDAIEVVGRAMARPTERCPMCCNERKQAYTANVAMVNRRRSHDEERRDHRTISNELHEKETDQELTRKG